MQGKDLLDHHLPIAQVQPAVLVTDREDDETPCPDHCFPIALSPNRRVRPEYPPREIHQAGFGVETGHALLADQAGLNEAIESITAGPDRFPRMPAKTCQVLALRLSL